MILEGFEIDNWSCIQHLVVSDIPATGITVLHGPNGIGKSSVCAALRACLMDYASTSTAQELKRYFPKNSGEKPRVAVMFRAAGKSYRITKHFGSKDSRLESRTSEGGWKIEVSSALDAHSRTLELLGGKKSMPGTNHVVRMPYFLKSAIRRGAPDLGPNSPREIHDGEVCPRAMKPEMASKSNVRQTM